MGAMRPRWRTLAALAVVAAIVAAAALVVWRIDGSRAPVDAATVYGEDAAAVAIAVTLLLSLGTWWQKGRAWPEGQGHTPSWHWPPPGWPRSPRAGGRRRRCAAGSSPPTSYRAVALGDFRGGRAPARSDHASGAGHGAATAPGRQRPGEGARFRPGNPAVSRGLRSSPARAAGPLGGPGVGKTGAMIRLLLAVLEHRTEPAGEHQAQTPVPVWLTLGGRDPLTESLHEWAAVTMNRDQPFLRAPDYGADAAGDLLRTGRVTLFLDGLDELPEDLQSAALRRVDEARGLRIVLSSRPAEFRHAVQEGRLDNAAVLELRPLRPAVAAAYLLHGQAGPSRSQWEEVGAYLRGHPDTVIAQAWTTR